MAGFQQGLFEVQVQDAPSFDRSWSRLERIQLDATAWCDFQRGWVTGSDRLFEQLRDDRPWKQRQRRVYGKVMLEPRLTAPWLADSGEPLEPKILEEMRAALSQRYGVELTSVGFNLYRDGNDAVAWHRDNISADVVDPIVVLVSLGEPRKLLLRPFGGGPSRPFALGRGDLFVTGGSCQRTWEHAVPRVAHAGPRISLAFRHGLNPRAYDEPRPAGAG
jgi:alkylated DNA repair dioxygenase AlkB